MDEPISNLETALQLERTKLTMLVEEQAEQCQKDLKALERRLAANGTALSGARLIGDMDVVFGGFESIIETAISYRKELAVRSPDLLLADHLKDFQATLEHYADLALLALQQRYQHNPSIRTIPARAIDAVVERAKIRAATLKGKVRNQITAMSLEGKLSMHHENLQQISTATISNPKSGASNIRIDNTVFISYRRTNAAMALAVSQHLTQNGYDVFFDYKGIASGSFEAVIFENIKARAHFVVLLTPTALDRCVDPSDLLGREIETALENRRNIVPLMLDGFRFEAVNLPAHITALERYNGLTVHVEYFDAAMMRLKKFLDVSLDTVLHPISEIARKTTQEDQAAAATAAPITQEELRETASARFIFAVKVKSQNGSQNIEGTRAEEPHGLGSLVIYDGNLVVARYSEVEGWSRQPQVSGPRKDEGIPPIATESHDPLDIDINEILKVLRIALNGPHRGVPDADPEAVRYCVDMDWVRYIDATNLQSPPHGEFIINGITPSGRTFLKSKTLS